MDGIARAGMGPNRQRPGMILELDRLIRVVIFVKGIAIRESCVPQGVQLFLCAVHTITGRSPHCRTTDRRVVRRDRCVGYGSVKPCGF